MKKTVCFLILFTFALVLAIPVNAETSDQRLFDTANILSSSEQEAINELLCTLSDDIQYDVVILTIPEMDASEQEDYAMIFQEEHSDYGNALLLFINLDDGYGRYLNAYGMGKAVDAIPDLDEFIDTFWEDVVAENYYYAFLKFAESARSYLTGTKKTDGNDEDVLSTGTLTSRSAGFSYVFDDAGIVTMSQALELEAMLKEFSEDCGYSILIHTVSAYDGYKQDLYAWDFQEAHSDVPDSVILFINLDDGYGRYINVFSMGKAENVFSDEEGIDEFIDTFWDDITTESYYSAFKKYAQEAHSQLGTYTVKKLAKRGVISLIVGAIAAWIGTSSMKSKLKSVAPSRAATNYVRNGSLVLTGQSDVYLYSTTSKTPKASSSSRSGGGGGYSSSGTHHSSGSGRHF